MQLLTSDVSLTFVVLEGSVCFSFILCLRAVLESVSIYKIDLESKYQDERKGLKPNGGYCLLHH